MKTQIKNKSVLPKTILAFILLLLFNANPVFAQWCLSFADTNSSFGSGGIFFTNSSTGYAVGLKEYNSMLYPKVVRTTNAGNNWSDLPTALSDTAGRTFRYVYFINANTGYITSDNTPITTTGGQIIKTTDAGSSWTITSPSVNKHLTCIWFVNSLTGYVSGYQTIIKTTDAGVSWQECYSPAGGAYLFGIYFLNVNTGFVVGNLGWIYKTTDAGSNWSMSRPQEYSTSLWSVWFVNENTGFVAGGHSSNVGNKIFRTTNCGTSWDSLIHPVSNNFLFSVRFVNENTGIVTGFNQALRTTNCGLNWFNSSLPIPPENEFFAAGTFFTDPFTGYIAGSTLNPGVAHVLKTTNGGVTFIKQISSGEPSDFKLEQNYPNPFNPSTNIRFDISKSAFVTLKVFDILGREVQTLVNEKLNAGKYETSFDGSKLNSGVYFYKLRSGDYTETRKMLLIK